MMFLKWKLSFVSLFIAAVALASLYAYVTLPTALAQETCPVVKQAKIDFFSSQDSGTSVANPAVRLGNGTTISPGQWFTVADSSGFINDPPLTTTFSGVTVRRDGGNIQLFAGSNPANTPKLVYGRLTFEGGNVGGVQNGISGLSGSDSLEMFGNSRWGVLSEQSSSSNTQCISSGPLGGIFCFVQTIAGSITCPIIGVFCPSQSSSGVSQAVYDDEAMSNVTFTDLYLHYGKQPVITGTNSNPQCASGGLLGGIFCFVGGVTCPIIGLFCPVTNTNSNVTYQTDRDSLTVSMNASLCSTPGPIPQCSDGQDNDGDDKVDCADPGCWTNISNASSCNPSRNDESHTPVVNPGGFKEVD